MTASNPDSSAQSTLLRELPEIPRELDEPVFKEPWQAEVFAIVLSLHGRGIFTWPEWAAMLSQEIRRAQRNGDADLGDTYYNHWLSALECILVAKDIGSESQLAELYRRWNQAAQETPHGQAIELS